MELNYRFATILVVLTGWACVFGCGASSPTGPSEVAGDSGPLGRFDRFSLTAQEDFNCESLTDANARFSDPGSIDQEKATLVYSYDGVPEGRHHLDIYWDFANDELTHQEVDLTLGTITRNDGLLNMSGRVAHTYEGLTETTSFTVRTLLWIEGMTGNCARVRHISVTPPPPAKVTCVTFGGLGSAIVPCPE